MATPKEYRFENKDQPDTRREMRVVCGVDIELRIEGEGDNKRLVGYAAKFNRWSVDLGIWEKFREKIAPGAFTETIKDSDTRALKNHDPNLILGRTSSGTLRLVENKTGLKFEIDMPNTSTGLDVLEEVRRGDITGCSFAFTVDEDSWKYLEDGSVERTINKVGELFDVGPVTYPAYPDTTVAARSLEAFQGSIEKEKREAAEKTEMDQRQIAEQKENAEKEQREKDESTKSERQLQREQKNKEDEEAQQKKEESETKRRIARGVRKAKRLIWRNRPA